MNISPQRGKVIVAARFLGVQGAVMLSLPIGYYHQFMDNNQCPWKQPELFEDSHRAALANSSIN